MSKNTIISPLNSVIKISKFIKWISIWILTISIIGIVTGGNKYILSLSSILSISVLIYQIIKIKKITSNIVIIEQDKMYINKMLINICDLNFETTKKGNIKIKKENKTLVIVPRLSYNFDVLYNYLNKTIT